MQSLQRQARSASGQAACRQQSRCVLRRPGRACSVKVSAELTLYTNPATRGKMPQWYLDELKFDYKSVIVDTKTGQNQEPSFLAISPFGKLPAMTDTSPTVSLFESGAILLYLARKMGKIQPADYAWVIFANSTLSDAFFNPQQRASQPKMLATLNSLLEGKKWLQGDNFTVSDVAVGGYLLYLPLFFPTMNIAGQYPNVWRYMTDLAARPACPEEYKQGIASVTASQPKGGALPPSANILGKIFGR